MKAIVILCILFGSVSLSAQERIQPTLQKSKLYFNLISPGISFEQRLNDNQTIMFTGGIKVLNDIFSEKLHASLNPYVRMDYRNYYARKRVNENHRANTGNYIGFVARYTFDGVTRNSEFYDFPDENKLTFGGVWGIQRNYASGIRLNLQLGPGIETNGERVGAAFIFDFTLGFAIGK